MLKTTLMKNDDEIDVSHYERKKEELESLRSITDSRKKMVKNGDELPTYREQYNDRAC
jgi:hypothetical protein